MQRRSLLTTAGSALAAPSMIGRAHAATPPFDPKNPAHISEAYRKLAFSADGNVTFTWLRGTRYALIDSVLTPLWELHSGVIFRTVDRPDGTYDAHVINAIYYTALETETFIEEFKNPFTGKTVTVPYAMPTAPKLGVSVINFAKGALNMQAPAPAGMKKVAEVRTLGPAWAVGGQAWVRGDTVTRMEPVEPGKRLVQVNDWMTFSGSAAAVMDPAIANPPATQIFNDINTFPAWLGMEDRPGNYVGRGFGAKVFSLADMEPVWRNLFTAKNPQIAKDPRAALGA